MQVSTKHDTTSIALIKLRADSLACHIGSHEWSHMAASTPLLEFCCTRAAVARCWYKSAILEHCDYILLCHTLG